MTRTELQFNIDIVLKAFSKSHEKGIFFLQSTLIADTKEAEATLTFLYKKIMQNFGSTEIMLARRVINGLKAIRKSVLNDILNRDFVEEKVKFLSAA